jgi:SAM-dependent methyltransferase
MPDNNIEYDRKAILFLEMVWGEGNLSPGGIDELKRLISGIDFTNKDVIDIGCGSGGNTIHLAKLTQLKSILGLDIEAPVIELAKERVTKLNLKSKVSYLKVNPGIFPFRDKSFDIIFSKDSLIHIADKDTLFRNFFRILSPGGKLVIGDWMISHDGVMSSNMKAYIKAEGLSFNMASPRAYESAMRLAGFSNIKVVNRNSWYLKQAQEELASMSGRLFKDLENAVGSNYVNKNIDTWKKMIKVLKSGEHCPTHIFATKT